MVRCCKCVAAVCIRVDRWAWLHVRQKGRPLRLAALQVPEDGFEQRVTPRGENYFRPSEAPASARRKQGSLRRSLLDDLTDDSQWFWMPHEDESYVAVKMVVDGGARCTVAAVQGHQEFTVNKADLIELKKDTLAALADDLTRLEELNVPLVMHNLRERAKNRQIYTNVGTILISINPYEMLPIYTPAVMDTYKNRGDQELDPHPFIIADECYRSLFEEGRNQSILVSGESGAGKTEATKVVLQYLAEIAGSTNGVEQRILVANPILEAFGNAKTLRNNNSSRFGKWVEIHFDSGSRICGAKIVNYLLEKSRVVYQAPEERNYHIFYQLLRGADAGMREKFGLQEPEDYHYTNQSGCVDIASVDDAEEFTSLMSAFQKLGFSQEEHLSVLSIVAAILHLGNIEFVADGDKSAVAPQSLANLALVASLLGVSEPNLQQALTFRSITVAGSTTHIPLNVNKATDSRDSLAKHLYGGLFEWLVGRINRSLSDGAKRPNGIIGVLDIFGFEVFVNNSFEQLCINFTNEKLQQKFNQSIFKEEMQIYRQEGIPIDSVTFEDNQNVLDLIEARPKGLLPQLDEELRMPQSTDMTYLQKIIQTFNGKKEVPFEKPVKLASHFSITHYAGPVTYNVDGFLDKNKDQMYDDLVKVMSDSSSALVTQLMMGLMTDLADSKAGSRGTMRASKRTLASQFTHQLNTLMDVINSTTPHYIRCIKPNSVKQPACDKFDGGMVLRQLRYAGVFGAVDIRKRGFPFRMTFEDFWKRFSILAGKDTRGSNWDISINNLFSAISDVLPPMERGKTRIFFRAEARKTLEKLRNEALKARIIKLQSVYRGWHWRKIYHQVTALLKKMNAAVENKDIPALAAAIGQLEGLEVDIRGIAEAKEVLNRLKFEKRITEGLQHWLDSVADRKDVTVTERDAAEGLIQDGADHGFVPPQVESVNAILAVSATRFAARQKVQQASDLLVEENMADLAAAIEAAAQAELTVENDDVLKVAAEKLQKLREEIEERERERERIRKEMEELERLRKEEEERMRKEAEEAAKSEELARIMAQSEAVQPVEETIGAEETTGEVEPAAEQSDEEESEEESDEDTESNVSEEPSAPVSPPIGIPPLNLGSGVSLPPPLPSSVESPKTMTLENPDIAAIKNAGTPRRGSSTPRTSRTPKVEKVERMPTPRLQDFEFVESPDKDPILAELKVALSIEPNPLAPGVSILADGAFMYTEEAKNTLIAINRRASAIKTQDVSFQSIYQASNLVLLLRHYLSRKDFNSMKLQLNATSNWRPVPFETIEIKAARDLVRKKELGFQLEMASQKYDDLRLRALLDEATSLGLTGLDMYQSMLTTLFSTRCTLEEGVRELDAVKLRKGMNSVTGMGVPDSFKPLMDEAYQSLHKIAGPVGAEVKRALEVVPSKEDLRALRQKVDLVGWRGLELLELDGLLALDAEKFCERQLKVAIANKDDERMSQLKVELKGHHLNRFAARLKFEDATVLKGADKYASSKLIGKEKLHESYMKWTKEPIPTTLTNTDKADTTRGTKLFKNILGWMGDRQLSYPVMLMQDIIKKAIGAPGLRDEVYCQIIKQLTENPSEESRRKGWHLMLICLMCFPPSVKFENYLGIWLKQHGMPYHVHELCETVVRGGLHEEPSTEELQYLLFHLPPVPGEDAVKAALSRTGEAPSKPSDTPSLNRLDSMIRMVSAQELNMKLNQ